MSLFKKPSRKFRHRTVRNDSDDETEAGDKKEDKSTKAAAEITQMLLKYSDSASHQRSEKHMKEKVEIEIEKITRPPSKLLSFHDDEEEEEVFKVKKSNYSRRLAKQLEKERKKKSDKGEFSKDENEQKIKEETPDTQIEEKQEKKDFEGIINGEDAEDMETDSDGGSKSENQHLHQFKTVLQSGIIPDAATIYAMKKHRQMAREMGDFIPTNETPEETDDQKSRLIREEDDDHTDDEDDEESGRINFTVHMGAVEKQKARAAFLSVQEREEAELEVEEADELERWEREQIRKGVSIAQVTQQPQPPPEQIYNFSQLPIPDEKPSLPVFIRTTQVPDIKPPVFMQYIPVPNIDKSALSTEIIKKRLQERLTSFDEVHRAHKNELEMCRSDLATSEAHIEQLEKEGPELAKRFSLYQLMRGYVTDLVECLDLKGAHVEILERQMTELLKERAEKLLHRRQQDIRDQSDEYSKLSSKLQKGSTLDIAEEKYSTQDEAKLRRIAEREGRRMRRRKRRESRQLANKHHEGMSSDDEEAEVDMIKFRNDKKEILDEAETVFEDVVEEFGTIQGVRNHFEDWKRKQPDTYKDAYVPLCLPKIMAYFVRLQLLDWNPLETNRSIDSMPWYQFLMLYGYKDENLDNVNEDDPDISLLPSIVEKVVLAKLTELVKNVWDPMSTNQTVKLVDLMRKLIQEYPSVNGKSKQMQAFLQAVVVRFYKTLDDDVFIPLYPKELLESRNYGAASYFNRQLWSCIKLFKNILSWHGILADNPLQDLSMAALLNRYLLFSLHNSYTQKDTMDKCRMIVSSIPKEWFSQLKGENSLPQLNMMCRFLKHYAQQLYSYYIKQDEPRAKDLVREIAQMLITVGALLDALEVAKQFSISGLKVPEKTK